MGQVDQSKKAIEAGLQVAGKLYKADSDDDDPNTALKAFWPSTNAYCALLRQAAHASPTWAISLLEDIKDPAVKISAETALAGGLLNAPIGPHHDHDREKEQQFNLFWPQRVAYSERCF